MIAAIGVADINGPAMSSIHVGMRSGESYYAADMGCLSAGSISPVDIQDAGITDVTGKN